MGILVPLDGISTEGAQSRCSGETWITTLRQSYRSKLPRTAFHGTYLYTVTVKTGSQGERVSISEELLAEFEVQAPVTRTFLERLPKDQLAWRPHPKSLTAGQLAYHLATVPGDVARTAQKDQVPPPNFAFPQPESLLQILQAFEESIAIVREKLPTFDDHSMDQLWRIVAGNQEVLAMPRQALLRNIMLNHWYQHRGQFSVYLRLLNVAVPSSWGPSADEAVVFPPPS